MLNRYTVKDDLVKLWFFILIIGFRVTLELIYYYVIYPDFKYLGFYSENTAIKHVESYLLTIVLVLFLPTRSEKPSDFFLFLFFLLPVLPTLILYNFYDADRAYVYMVVAFFLLLKLFTSKPFTGTELINNGRKIAVVVAAACTVMSLFWIVRSGGVSYLDIRFSTVYERREEVAGVVSLGFFSYILIWVSKTIVIFLLAQALLARKYLYVLVLIGVEVFLFAVLAHKSIIFYPFLVVAIYWLSKKNYNHSFVMKGVYALVLACVLLLIITRSNFLFSLIFRRVFFVPARLNFAYYEVFSNRGFVFFSNSFLSNIIEYPHPFDPPQLVSMYIKGHVETNMNNGCLGTAYMQLGFPGMMLYALIIGLILNFVDTITHNRLPVWFAVSVCVVPFFTLFTSSDLPTTLITHGLLLSIALLWLTSTMDTFPRFIPDLPYVLGKG